MQPERPTPADSREFAGFMRAYEDRVFSTVVRLTADAAQAEDITQEVFLRAYERFDQLRASASAGGWLRTVATNLALNHLSRYRKRWRLFSELADDDSAGEVIDRLEPALAALDGLFAQTDAEERRALVARALAELPEHQRVPLVLFHFEEMSYRQIAARLGISLAKLKTDMLRGRIALATRLAPSGGGRP